ncbi:hypothetical protein CMK22_02140 [Candidatus Poribacteria bacterium]|nr:hypothetical protein [Candidatus Poribacteria bacterium]
MKQPNREHLWAGAALVDITPSVGTHLSGSGCGEHHPAISILDLCLPKQSFLSQKTNTHA